MPPVLHPYRGELEHAQIDKFIRTLPAGGRHLVDFPWRLCAPMTNPAQDACLCTINDQLVGFAAWRNPWATLDLYIQPGPEQEEIEAALFDWAARRFHELDHERGYPLPYWVEGREDDKEQLALLARHGYTLEDGYSYVMLSCALAGSLPHPELPPGFILRPLAGESEVSAYVALHRRAFASTSMTVEWRRSTLHMTGYQPEFDLVAVAPDGALAGFCIGWGAPERNSAQIEPIGVDPALQRRGLGRALLLEMLARFKAYGVANAQVETNSGRAPALRAYREVGFLPLYQTTRRGQWFSPQSALPQN